VSPQKLDNNSNKKAAMELPHKDDEMLAVIEEEVKSSTAARVG